VSASAVFAFLAAVPAVAPVAVEPLLPMGSARGKGFENGDGQEEQQEQSARRKTMAAEWGELLLLRCHFYLISGNLRLILAVHYEVETAEQIWPSTCQYHENRGFHYARQSRKPGGLFSPMRGTCSQTWSTAGACEHEGPQDVWSCHCQPILAEGGVTTRRVQASSWTSWFAERFPLELKDKLDFGPSYFRGMYFSKAKLFRNWVFSQSFFSSFLKILPFERLFPMLPSL
jgi:hypothetical protein